MAKNIRDVVRTTLRLLPGGIPLTADQWSRRHRAILTILWLHAVAIPAMALYQGNDLLHSASEGMLIVVCAAIATPSVLGDRRLTGRLGQRVRAVATAVGLVASSAALVHLSGGLVEMHFHFFVILGVITLYQDWTVFLTAIVFVAVHHGVVGMLYPQEVYNHPAAWNNPWKWALVHAGFVLAASAAQITAWRFTEDQYRRAEIQLRERDQRFRSLIENSSDGITVIGADGSIIYDSPSVATILGHQPGERAGLSAFDSIHPDDLVAARSVYAEMLSGELAGTVALEVRARHRDGSWRSLEARVTNLLDTPDVRGIVANFRDVTERKELEDQLTHRAFHDPLTELPNRALFLDRISHAIATQKRTGEMLAVMFIDLDDFKTINDGLGHAAGDLVLTEVAGRLQRCLREADTCARLGGDEFGILLEGLVGPGEAYDVGSRLLEAMAEEVTTPTGVAVLNASLGIVISADGGDDPGALVRNADLAMYEAKSQGKGRYSIFEIGMHDAVVERLELKADLRHAVDRGEFVVHYQPIVDLLNGAVVGAEALVRWDHPKRGILAPAAFLPLAEETGLISPIGSFVLKQACSDASQWRCDDGNALHINVNLSASQLKHDGLVVEVAAVLEQTALEPSALTLEITETLLMEDPERAAEVIHALKDLGVKIALDDFGTGFSSLSYLSRFPVDCLKIDKSFVDALAGGGSVDDVSLVRAITGLGEMLKLQVTAEGIERPGQLAELLGLGCHLGQGFHFAKAVAHAEFTQMLRTSSPYRSAGASDLAETAVSHPTAGL